MNDDEDSLGSWLLSVGIGIAFALIFIGWPILFWWIVWSVFR